MNVNKLDLLILMTACFVGVSTRSINAQESDSSGTLTATHSSGRTVSIVPNEFLISIEIKDNEKVTVFSPVYKDNVYLHAVCSQVERAWFVDKDTLAIVSRMGRRMDGLVLVDLKKQTVVRDYWGGAFSTAPGDPGIFAYVVPSGHGPAEDVELFVTDTKIFPSVKSNDVSTTLSQPTLAAAQYDLLSQIQWNGNKQFSCVLGIKTPESKLIDPDQPYAYWVDFTVSDPAGFKGTNLMKRISQKFKVIDSVTADKLADTRNKL